MTVLVAGGLAYLSLGSVPDRLVALSDAVIDQESRVPTGQTVPKLFQDLLRYRLIKLRVDDDTATLRLPPRDLEARIIAELRSRESGNAVPGQGTPVRDAEAAGWADTLMLDSDDIGPVGILPAPARDALKRLADRSDGNIGKTIIQAVTAWNAIHALSAIRDSTDEATNSIYATGDENVWQINEAWEIAGSEVERAASTWSGLPFETYGHFGWGEDAPRGAWQSSRPSDRSRRLRARRAVKAGDDLVIDVLGLGFKKGIAPSLKDQRGSSAGEHTLLCKDAGERNAPARADDCDGKSDWASHRFRVPSASYDRKLTLEMWAIAQLSDALKTTLGPSPDKPLNLPLGTHLGLPPDTHSVTLGAEKCLLTANVDGDRYAGCVDEGWRIYADGRPIVLLCKGGPIGEQAQARPEAGATSAADDSANSDSAGRSDAAEQLKCSLDWFDLQRSSRPESVDVEILSRDNVVLARNLQDEDDSDDLSSTRPERGLTEDAVELGLSALLGAGGIDRAGLLSALTRATGAGGARPEKINLSLDSQIQEIVAKRVNAYERVSPDSLVAVVLMDASGRCWDSDISGCGVSDRGQIRAAYSARARRGSDGDAVVENTANFSWGVWNTLGLQYWRDRPGEQPPLTPFSYTNLGSQFAPGSTMKSLTALAAIKRVVEEEAPEIRKLLEGVENPRTIGTVARLPDGVDVDSQFVDIKWDGGKPPPSECVPPGKPLKESFARICNFKNTGNAIVDSNREIVKSPFCTDGVLGLCEATRRSYNNWFIVLALALEQHRPSHVTKKGSDAEPALVEMARRLMTLDRVPLMPKNWAIAKNAAWRWSRWAASGYQAMEAASSVKTESPRMFVLAQNSLGQNVQASALTIAQLYASIATGCVVAPRFAGREPACKGLFADSPQSATNRAGLELMEKILVPGLNAVVNQNGSTAYPFLRADGEERGYFQHLRAKTGTADFSATLGNTAWLAGWIEPEGLPGLRERMSYACMITGARRPYRTGGQACGLLMRQIFDDLQSVNR